MAENDFIIKGKKELKQKTIDVRLERNTTSFLIDEEAAYMYYSKGGGFLPPSQCLESVLTSAIHYGSGLFEGMRYYYSPYGTVIIEPWENIARMFHSATFFTPILAKEIKSIFEKEDNVIEIKLDAITPAGYYRIAERAYREGKNPSFPITVIKNIDGKKQEEKRWVELKLHVVHENSVRVYSMAEVDALIKTLAFLNRLASEDYFPNNIEMILAGYIRPFAWVSGEKGLKVPTILKTQNGVENKPLYFAIATLPWGVYLNENDYERGLDVLIGPYTRVGKDMPGDAKIAGNYVNSLLNVNLGIMFGYGEILALNNNRHVVEGSAENLFVIYQRGKNITVYTPPTGSGCLPGTTRDRIIRTLERMGAAIVYRSPTLNDVYNADAVLLSGTGAQMIHIRSVSRLKAVEKIAEMMHLQSENKKEKLSIKREHFGEGRIMINNGRKHQVVDKIKNEYSAMLLSNKDALEPVYNINFDALCNILNIEKRDVMSKEEIAAEKAGYFEERVNGLTQPNELAEKFRKAARIIKNVIEKNNKNALKKQALIT